MKIIFMIISIMLAMTSQSLAQLYHESIFGMNIPVQRWTRSNDMLYFDGPSRSLMGQASDIGNIRFCTENDTADIILAIDYGASKILWLRAPAHIVPRPIHCVGSYGEFGNGPGQFITPYSIAAASSSEIFNPATDHVFVGDRMSHSIIRFNFEFHPSSPESDTILWESSTFVDSNFAPIDLEYVDYRTGNINDNRLIALDDIGGRLAVFSHNGDLLQILNLDDPADTITHIYSASTHKVNPNGSVTFYLADRDATNVRRYVYTVDGQLNYLNEINLGDRMETTLSDVIYSEMFGLWALESRGPHLFKLAQNLSRVLFEVSGEQFNPQSLFHPFKICILPDRLIVFEEMGPETGLLSFAFNPPSGKRENNTEEIIPFKFALNQNYPNPFNPNTTISFEVPSTQWVRLEIFNILGQKVKTLADEQMSAGRYSLVWDGKNGAGRYVSTGVYFSRLSAGDNTEIKKMLMLK